MDPYFSYDKAFVDARRKEGTYAQGDERPRHAQCECCERSFVMKLGQYRDLKQTGLPPKCKPCHERDVRYRDIVAAANSSNFESPQNS